jgi:REP element-mobilizing transposase RayT
MARGIEGAKIFRSNANREKFIEYLEELVNETETRIPAWSLVGNHFHLLLFSGPRGLPSLMRRLMTRYAVYFNRKHHRSGHLFQNRYKSLICEEESYFLELVRYIHLNPLRAGMVTTLEELDAYPYSGHSAIMGRAERPWQDRLTVLKAFSDATPRAISLYRAFVDEGKADGKRPDLTGGGLKRSLGGSLPARREGLIAYDARILGGGDFVLRIHNEAEQARPAVTQINVPDRIARICKDHGISPDHLVNGSRTHVAAEARGHIIEELVSGSGFGLSEVARLIGISPSGVANVLAKMRRMDGE